MRNRPEHYEETVNPADSAERVTGPAMVAGLWYYLAPLGLVLLLVVLAFLYWGDSGTVEEPVEPTTGVVGEPTPGGGEPARGYDTSDQETEYRGGN